MGDIVIRIPDEIKDYSEKMGGFTFRQWVGIALICITCVPFGIWAQCNGFGTQSSLLNIIMGGTIAVVCFFKINGMNFEKIFPYIKRSFLIYNVVLPKKSENECKIEQVLLYDKKYSKMKSKVSKSLGKPEYMLRSKEKEELYLFRGYESRLIQRVSEYLRSGDLPTKKEMQKIGKEVRRESGY